MRNRVLRNRVLVWLRTFRADQKGLSAVETGLAGALIAVSIIGGGAVLGPQLTDMYANIFNPHVGPLGAPHGAGSNDPSSDVPEEDPDSPFAGGEDEPDEPSEPIADSGSGPSSDPVADDPGGDDDDKGDTGDKDDKKKKEKKDKKSHKKH